MTVKAFPSFPIGQVLRATRKFRDFTGTQAPISDDDRLSGAAGV
jgi:hypothetical protein